MSTSTSTPHTILEKLTSANPPFDDRSKEGISSRVTEAESGKIGSFNEESQELQLTYDDVLSRYGAILNTVPNGKAQVDFDFPETLISKLDSIFYDEAGMSEILQRAIIEPVRVSLVQSLKIIHDKKKSTGDPGYLARRIKETTDLEVDTDDISATLHSGKCGEFYNNNFIPDLTLIVSQRVKKAADGTLGLFRALISGDFKRFKVFDLETVMEKELSHDSWSPVRQVMRYSKETVSAPRPPPEHGFLLSTHEIIVLRYSFQEGEPDQSIAESVHSVSEGSETTSRDQSQRPGRVENYNQPAGHDDSTISKSAASTDNSTPYVCHIKYQSIAWGEGPGKLTIKLALWSLCMRHIIGWAPVDLSDPPQPPLRRSRRIEEKTSGGGTAAEASTTQGQGSSARHSSRGPNLGETSLPLR